MKARARSEHCAKDAALSEPHPFSLFTDESLLLVKHEKICLNFHECLHCVNKWDVN